LTDLVIKIAHQFVSMSLQFMVVRIFPIRQYAAANSIGDAGAIAMGAALEVNSALVSLMLESAFRFPE
jgi:hypothetical protein